MLKVENIHTYYGPSHVLQGVSLRVEEGEIVALLGRNGAGKTTTLKSIMGVTPARRGRITFQGKDITRTPTHQIARAGIALVPDDRRIFPNLTVAENLRMGMLKDQRRDGREAEALLRQVFTHFPRLQERIAQVGKSLSGGEQQMLAIARGLVARPKLMLVDEPTEGLMPVLVQGLTEILRQINRDGVTILLVEQDLDVALSLASRGYVIDQGVIQFQGTTQEIRANREIQQRYLGVS
jgi:branched-chain amino acid transport system ATP-binding protein